MYLFLILLCINIRYALVDGCSPLGPREKAALQKSPYLSHPGTGDQFRNLCPILMGVIQQGLSPQLRRQGIGEEGVHVIGQVDIGFPGDQVEEETPIENDVKQGTCLYPQF